MEFIYTERIMRIYRKTLTSTDKHPPVVFLLLYINDVIITAESLDEINKVKKQLYDRYTIKNLGRIHQFLNIKLTPLFDLPNNRALFEWNQSLYIDELLKKHHMLSCIPKKVLMIHTLKIEITPTNQLEKKIEEKSLTYLTKYYARDPSFNLKTEFQTIIGTLMYLCCTTRFDITFSTHQLKRWANDLKWFHFQHALKILKYLKATKNYRLKIASTYNFIRIYSDADFAEDKKKRKSTSRTFIILGNSPITRQASIASSAMEAEYITLAHAAIQNITLKNQFHTFNFYASLTFIYCDNNDAISIAKGTDTPQSKSIEIRWHKVQEYLQRK